MSDVQQALALGRRRLDQNVYYQHSTIEENTATHQDFLAFSSYYERIDFLHTGIREKRIQGALTSSYHSLLLERGIVTAEAFLTVHATALHVTPFGACIHDFSQAPCPKHLQCWNGCSHLHLMGTPSERANLESQAEHLTTAIAIMRDVGAGEAGSDLWLADQEDKLNNLKNVLARDTSVRVQVGDRGRRIESARIIQLKESGRDPDGARRRRSLEERISKLQVENTSLIRQRDNLYEALSVIVNNCLLKGLNVEDALAPLRNREDKPY
ncbi:hypothetical protein [Pseudomonas protegens]|uniref:hypothetical protein n=1 Tax=Pseudomonas protegens TaxID=380021 RepID=UPI0021B025F0|nr:hypothetical protein [Pseudomonas protegens]